jgi:hypothetical protein
MPLPEPVTDIPPAEVGQVVQDFVTLDEVKRMDVRQQADGNYAVTPKK